MGPNSLMVVYVDPLGKAQKGRNFRISRFGPQGLTGFGKEIGRSLGFRV